MNKFNYNESLRFERLSDTFTRNFRLTSLYATYLERFPNAVTPEIMDMLCGDGDLSVKDALPALISELFSLDTDGNDGIHFEKHLGELIKHVR